MVHAVPLLVDLFVTKPEIRRKIDHDLAGPKALIRHRHRLGMREAEENQIGLFLHRLKGVRGDLQRNIPGNGRQDIPKSDGFFLPGGQKNDPDMRMGQEQLCKFGSGVSCGAKNRTIQHKIVCFSFNEN